jgi:hypothetical protein
MTQSPAEEASPFVVYPRQAEFGRVVPKNKIYEHGQVNTRLKELFVGQVEQIVWQYKLAPETINLPAKPGVPEIQVFRIALKTADLSVDVLKAIDAAVQFPMIFELDHRGKTQVIAAYKRPSEAAANHWVISDYFASPWLPADTRRSPLPTVLDLGGLYEALLQRLLPLAPRAHESLAGLVERVASVRAKQCEIEQVRAKLAREKQFKRKVDINCRLKKLKADLERLEI